MLLNDLNQYAWPNRLLFLIYNANLLQEWDPLLQLCYNELFATTVKGLKAINYYREEF